MRIKLLIICFIICQSTFGQTGVNYSQSSSYNNLKLPIEDFKKVVSIIEYYNNQSFKDTSYHDKGYHFSCNLSGSNGKAIAISTFKQIADLKLDPMLAHAYRVCFVRLVSYPLAGARVPRVLCPPGKLPPNGRTDHPTVIARNEAIFTKDSHEP